MTGDVTDQLTGKKKSIGWKLVFISWLLFIVIDVFNTGLFVVLFNLAGKYSSSNSVPGHSINWSFEMRYGLAGLFYGIYKLSLVPFYWAVLATMVVQIGKFKTIFMSSLVVTVFLVVFCFVSMLLIFYLLVLFRSGQNYLHGLVDSRFYIRSEICYTRMLFQCNNYRYYVEKNH